MHGGAPWGYATGDSMQQMEFGGWASSDPGQVAGQGPAFGSLHKCTCIEEVAPWGPYAGVCAEHVRSWLLRRGLFDSREGGPSRSRVCMTSKQGIKLQGGVLLAAVSVQHRGQRGLVVLHSEAEDVNITSASSEMPPAPQ